MYYLDPDSVFGHFGLGSSLSQTRGQRLFHNKISNSFFLFFSTCVFFRPIYFHWNLMLRMWKKEVCLFPQKIIMTVLQEKKRHSEVFYQNHKILPSECALYFFMGPWHQRLVRGESLSIFDEWRSGTTVCTHWLKRLSGSGISGLKLLPVHSPLSFIIALIMSGKNMLLWVSSVMGVTGWVTHLSWTYKVPVILPGSPCKFVSAAVKSF